VSPPPEVNVVLWARLYRVLADRPEYLRHDLAERVDRTAATASPFLSPVDGDLIALASELDLLCGYAVQRLREKASAPVLDLLGVLTPHRLAAVALALPEDRRAAVLRRDPYWARAVAALDPDALAVAREAIEDMGATVMESRKAIRDDLGDEFADVWDSVDQDLRRQGVGLPPEDDARPPLRAVAR